MLFSLAGRSGQGARGAVRPERQDLRNRAIPLLLARVGLRAGEILRLCLGDIDRRDGHLLVRAGTWSGFRSLRLPSLLSQGTHQASTADLPGRGRA